MINIKIIDKFNYQTFPITEGMIKVNVNELELIGISKCFDVENNTIIDYVNTKKINEDRIAELKKKLADTDYKAIKYAEGLINEEDYAETKAQRQAWRDEINKLEQQI